MLCEKMGASAAMARFQGKPNAKLLGLCVALFLCYCGFIWTYCSIRQDVCGMPTNERASSSSASFGGSEVNKNHAGILRNSSDRSFNLLRDYQRRSTVSLLRFLQRHLGRSSISEARILDNGCDLTGNVGTVVGQYVKAYVGVNCPFELERLPQVTFGVPNAVFVETECKGLPFPDETFDVVFSDNVLEHAHPVSLYIRETFRVLKRNGLALFLWDPVWTGPMGHHIHEDMVQRRARRLNTSSQYLNDGSFIPPWGHLLLTKAEMNDMLLAKPKMGSQQLIDGIVEFIYESSNINRVSLGQIMEELQSQSWSQLPESNECSSVTRHWMAQGEVHLARPLLKLQTLKQLRQLFPNEARFDLGPCVFAAQKL